jgi:hypothetical protein
MQRRRAFLVPLLLLAGCGGAQQSATVSTAPAAGTTTGAAAEKMAVYAYFLRDERVAVARERVTKSPGVARAAVETVADCCAPPQPASRSSGTRKALRLCISTEFDGRLL